MKAIERIIIYLKYRELSVSEFERINNLSNGYISKMKARNANIGEDTFLSILEHCPDINPSWLIKGEGEMLRTEKPITNKIVFGNKGDVVSDSQNVEINKNDSEDLRAELIESYKEQIRMLKEKIEEKSKELAEKCNDLERLKQEYDDLKNDKSF